MLCTQHTGGKKGIETFLVEIELGFLKTGSYEVENYKISRGGRDEGVSRKSDFLVGNVSQFFDRHTTLLPVTTVVLFCTDCTELY